MTHLFPDDIHELATAVVTAARRHEIRIATAETVTGGLVAAALTEVPGVSEVFERGYVLYHADAKSSGLGVDPALAAEFGAVSEAVTTGLARGLRANSGASLGVAVTGYAGPTGGNAADPVGTVYVALYSGDDVSVVRRVHEGDRLQVKLAAVSHALGLLDERLSKGSLR